MTQDEFRTRLLAQMERIAQALEAAPPEEDAPLPADARVFRWEPPRGLSPVARPARIAPELLTGIDRQRDAFYENIRRFTEGLPALDVILWGERGTGKSSLVSTLPLRFPGGEPALVAVRESDLDTFSALLDRLARHPRRWIALLDDLSFSRTDAHYSDLKVYLEGALEARPENVLAVATSNRRHLVPETFARDDEIHPQETVAESISLADRFGLSLGFHAFDADTYVAAVARHLDALGHGASGQPWREEAIRWAMRRGIRSGRSAMQFARAWVGGGGAQSL